MIVTVADGSEPAAVARQHARRFGADVGFVYRHALRGYAAVVPAARLDALRADASVVAVDEDRDVATTAQTLPTGVDRMDGDLSSTLAGNGWGAVGTPVAVIDTGIDPTHPDLNVRGGYNCGNGTSYTDGNGHGSHVAGTIGAKDDGVGAVGVAPGTPLYAVRVLNNNGSGSWSSVICGIDWVTANAASTGIKVANMSLGGTGSDSSCASDAMHRAICNSTNAGVTYVVAAGNDGADLGAQVPATYGEVLTVTAEADFNGKPGGGAGATCRADVDETPADFSNYTTVGSADAAHTIAAPGVCIFSTWKRGGYNTISGTSMASPHVAGAAALCLATACNGMSPSQVIAKLRSDAAARPAGYGFTGDPYAPLTSGGRTLYYGHLAYAGGY